ncbi:MAG: ABC transporter ATP-binding protein [Muribaculaceae bacterium]|nr:ABC transporter ATP-binding protein [Muribaculaceae bacterium]
MLTVKDLSFGYSRRRPPVLSHFSMNVGAGEICGLLGPNGSGKSTLLYLVAGLLTPGAGGIDFKGHSPRHRDVEFLNDVFIVPEEFNLPPVTLESYVSNNAVFYPRFSHESLRTHLQIFGLDTDVHLGRLSMGQKKKVFMSFALACNTSLLLMDEPTNGLDIPGKRSFRQSVVKEMSDDRTIIISTHQVHDVERILDHVMIIEPTRGLLLDAGIADITERLRFAYTDSRDAIQSALLALPAPGGANIVELGSPELPETEVNLETLFELAQQRPDLIAKIFPTEKA